MDYSELVDVYDRLESTPKRLGKTKIIADFLRSVEEADLSSIILLLQGRVFPRGNDTKIGVASKLVLKAIAKSSGKTAAQLEKDWKKIGDLGKVAQASIENKSQSTLFSKSLTVAKVFSNLTKLPTLERQGSVDQKLQLIAELLTSAKPTEARYVTRTLLEDLRVGVGEGSLRDAITWAFFEKEIEIEYQDENIEFPNREKYNEYVNAVQQAYDITNDFAAVAKICKESGLKGLLDQDLVLGNPVKVMLAIKANSAQDALERVGTPAEAEFKLDGFRMQIHKEKDRVSLFTRRLEDVTAQFPDVVKCVIAQVSAQHCILDAEVVGYDEKTGKYLPFQSISQRIRRKYNIDEMARKFPVEINVFDILFYEGDSLIKEEFGKRRALLESMIKEKKHDLILAQKLITSDVKEVDDFFKQSLDAGNEGLMIKNLKAPYKPGARVGHMVKLKETLENLDLVIIGAEWGEGKRANWLSSFTLACRDDNGDFLEIGKVATGLKEKEEEGLSFKEMTDLLSPLILSEKGRDVTLKPEIVIEIAYEEIQKSPTYASGFALRFPRVVRLRNDERGIDDVTGLDYVEELYYAQKK